MKNSAPKKYCDKNGKRRAEGKMGKGGGKNVDDILRSK
jgi:hypothetical protein